MATQQGSIFEHLPDPDPANQDGETFDAGVDGVRLNAQTQRIFEAMKDHQWRTLGEIAAITRDGEPSISARLRDLRKEKFGSYEVARRRRGEAKRGLWEFQLGEKGAGSPHERGPTPPPHEAALRAADVMISYLRHTEICDVHMTYGAVKSCNCGMDEVRNRYQRARQRTRGQISN